MQVTLEQAYEVALAEIGRLVVANKILSAGIESTDGEDVVRPMGSAGPAGPVDERGEPGPLSTDGRDGEPGPATLPGPPA